MPGGERWLFQRLEARNLSRRDKGTLRTRDKHSRESICVLAAGKCRNEFFRQCVELNAEVLKYGAALQSECRLAGSEADDITESPCECVLAYAHEMSGMPLAEVLFGRTNCMDLAYTDKCRGEY